MRPAGRPGGGRSSSEASTTRRRTSASTRATSGATTSTSSPSYGSHARLGRLSGEATAQRGGTMRLVTFSDGAGARAGALVDGGARLVDLHAADPDLPSSV